MEDILKKEDQALKNSLEFLESYFKKKVIAIVYNPDLDQGIRPKDEILFEFFKERVVKQENLRDCIVILNGFGGDLKTALLCSCILRNSFKYYCCFVPSVIGSSLCYFALQANKLIIGKNSILTQIDPLIEHKGEQLRAIENLTNIDAEKRKKSSRVIGFNTNVLKKILKKGKILSKECFSKRDELNLWELGRIIDLFMGKETHWSGLSITDLTDLKINLFVEKDQIVSVANKVVSECRKELRGMKGYNRFVIQCSGGGYYFN